jgi:hypothetical protein
MAFRPPTGLVSDREGIQRKVADTEISRRRSSVERRGAIDRLHETTER